MHIGNKNIRGCIACRSCVENGKCVFDDTVNETAAKFAECDGIVVGSPVYYASANATLVAFLTRLFYSTDFDKSMKVGAAVVAARRGGLSSTFDELKQKGIEHNVVFLMQIFTDAALKRTRNASALLVFLPCLGKNLLLKNCFAPKKLVFSCSVVLLW